MWSHFLGFDETVTAFLSAFEPEMRTPQLQGHACNEPRATLALLAPLQRRAHVEASVLRVVRELASSYLAEVDADTPLLEAGIDSFAGTELSSRLRALTDIAPSNTLHFEQPTPRAVAKHLLDLIGDGSAPSQKVASVQDAYIVTELLHNMKTFAAIVPVRSKRRVLLLHGQQTSASVVHHILSVTGWTTNSPFEFVVPDGPHEMCAFSEDDIDEMGGRTLLHAGIYDFAKTYYEWGAAYDVLTGESPHVTSDHCVKFKQTIDYVQALVQRYGPFDGLAGFCEGGAVAHHLMQLPRVIKAKLGLENINFFLLLSSWISPLTEQMEIQGIPALITLGTNDASLFLTESTRVEETLLNPLRYNFPGVHEFPKVLSGGELQTLLVKLVEQADAFKGERKDDIIHDRASPGG